MPRLHTRAVRRGFTLVELIVALLLADVALLALVGASAVLARELGRSANRSQALARAAARLDRIASRSCAAAASGDTAWSPGTHEWWTAARESAGALLLADSASYPAGRGAMGTVVLRTRMLC